MLGLPQCQRCGSEVDYDNHGHNGYNGKNGYNCAIMALMTKMVFLPKGQGCGNHAANAVFQHLSMLVNEHCVGSLDRISKFLGSSSTPFPWLGTRQSTGFALPVWPLRVCACPAAGFGFMNSTTLCTKNS